MLVKDNFFARWFMTEAFTFLKAYDKTGEERDEEALISMRLTSINLLYSSFTIIDIN